MLPRKFRVTRAYLRLRIAERYKQNPFEMEKQLTDRQLEILESQERVRLAEEAREFEVTMKMLAAGAGVQV